MDCDVWLKYCPKRETIYAKSITYIELEKSVTWTSCGYFFDTTARAGGQNLHHHWMSWNEIDFEVQEPKRLTANIVPKPSNNWRKWKLNWSWRNSRSILCCQIDLNQTLTKQFKIKLTFPNQPHSMHNEPWAMKSCQVTETMISKEMCNCHVDTEIYTPSTEYYKIFKIPKRLTKYLSNI